MRSYCGLACLPPPPHRDLYGGLAISLPRNVLLAIFHAHFQNTVSATMNCDEHLCDLEYPCFPLRPLATSFLQIRRVCKSWKRCYETFSTNCMSWKHEGFLSNALAVDMDISNHVKQDLQRIARMWMAKHPSVRLQILDFWEVGLAPGGQFALSCDKPRTSFTRFISLALNLLCLLKGVIFHISVYSQVWITAIPWAARALWRYV